MANKNSCALYCVSADYLFDFENFQEGNEFCLQNNWLGVVYNDFNFDLLKKHIQNELINKVWVYDFNIFISVLKNDSYILNFLELLDFYNVDLYVNNILQDIDVLLNEYLKKTWE